VLLDPDPGNSANFTGGNLTSTLSGGVKLTDVGQFSQSSSAYGTFEQSRQVLADAHEQQGRAAAERLFARVREQAEAAGAGFESVVVESSEVWQAILAAARKKQCDAICMASHGRRGVAGVLLGSETQKVLTHSSLPVLVLR